MWNEKRGKTKQKRHKDCKLQTVQSYRSIPLMTSRAPVPGFCIAKSLAQAIDKLRLQVNAAARTPPLKWINNIQFAMIYEDCLFPFFPPAAQRRGLM